MDTQKVLGFIVLFLSIAIISLVMYFQPFGNIFDILAVILVIVDVMYILLQTPLKNEHFDQKQTNTTNTIDQLTAIGNNGVENVTPFSKYMTIYYSAFSPLSYPKPARTLYNLQTINGGGGQNTCSADSTNAVFSNIPSFTQSNGFALGNNTLTGPMSFKMGIDMNDSFTIAFTIQFDAFQSNPSPNILEILKLYANTLGNNGLSLYITNDYSVIGTGNDYAINMFLKLGDGAPVQISGLPSINTLMVYMFVIQGKSGSVNMTIYPNIVDISSTISNVITAVSAMPVTENILLSNKEIKINTYGNLQSHLYNFGVWNNVLNNTTTTDFYKNTQIMLQKNNEILSGMASQIKSLVAQINNANACPYDKPTCDICSGVTDWNNMSNFILNAGPECMSAIDKYCTAHPTAEMCTCWNSSSALSKTPQCKLYQRIYKQNTNSCDLSVDTITPSILESIQEKYNLCGCSPTNPPTHPPSSVPAASSASSASSSLALLPAKLPVPKLIDTTYHIDQNDIDLYNKLQINKGKTNTETLNTGIFNSLLGLIKM